MRPYRLHTMTVLLSAVEYCLHLIVLFSHWFLVDFIHNEYADYDFSFRIYLQYTCGVGVDEEEELKITALQRKRNQLAGYCKLIIYGVLELRAAADVFKHYSKVCVRCVWDEIYFFFFKQIIITIIFIF